MNGISFNPNYNQTELNSGFKFQNKPAFQGIPKTPNTTQTKKTVGILSNIYKLLFIPRHEKVVSISDGTVRTISGSKKCTVGKIYPLWSKRPNVIIKDYPSIGIRQKSINQKDKKFDYEISDVTDPNYKISAAYRNIDKNNPEHKDLYDRLDLTYCNKKVSITYDKCKELMRELSKSIDERYRDDMTAMLNPNTRTLESYNELYSRFFKDPEVAGKAILLSPKQANKQTEIAIGSLPHGIKFIIDKLG